MLQAETGIGDGPLPVLPLPRSGGGSGTGISHYTQVIRCPRKADLDRQLVQLGQHEDVKSGGTAVGTIFHQLGELYYGQGIDKPYACPIGDMNWGEAIDEAKRVWKAYIGEHPGRNYWGEVIGAEYQLPQNDAQKEIVTQTVGIDPFTMRIDLVVRVGDRVIPGIAPLQKGGIYLVDYKTSAREDGTAPLRYQNSLQFAAYQMVWNATFPNDPCHGMLVINVITTKEVKFRYFLVTPPDEKGMTKVRTMLSSAKALESTKAALGVSFGCMEFNRVCSHLNTRCEGF